MKKYIKILIKIILCILIAFNLTACWSSHELNKLAIIMGIGIDKGRDPDQLKMTVQLAKVSEIKGNPKGGGESANAAGYINFEENGKSISEAVMNFSRKLNRKLFFSHNQIIIIGKDAAEVGVEKYMDFFLRYRESRLLVWILISKGSANEILNIKPQLETTPGRNIGELVKNEEDTSQIPAVNLKDFATRLMSKTTAPIAPIIELSKEENKVYLSETAVFKKDKMVGTLDKKETRGLLWCINKVNNGVVVVSTPLNKEIVNIKTSKVSSKIIPEMKNNKPSIRIEIKQEGDLQEQAASEDLANPKAFEVLQKAEAYTIKEEIMSSLKKAKELHADIFGFGDAIYQHYPKQWKTIENNWDKVFQNINVEVNVDAKLRRTGKITKPIMSKE